MASLFLSELSLFPVPREMWNNGLLMLKKHLGLTVPGLDQVS